MAWTRSKLQVCVYVIMSVCVHACVCACMCVYLCETRAGRVPMSNMDRYLGLLDHSNNRGHTTLSSIGNTNLSPTPDPLEFRYTSLVGGLCSGPMRSAADLVLAGGAE